MPIRLATRGSSLALWQAGRIADLIAEAAPGTKVELVVISTSADRNQELPLHEFGDKGLFVKEIEEALFDGRADAAIHSLKDVPGELPSGLMIAATPERADPRDVLISAHKGGLADLPPGAVVATSSLRRRGQLMRIRPDLRTVDVRGNVENRIRKVREGQFDAIILASAGVHRLGLELEISEIIPADQMIPAATQGILGIETPVNTPYADLWHRVDNPAVRTAADAEREFVRAIGADCYTPAACYCSPAPDDDGLLRIVAMVCTPDATRHLTSDITCRHCSAMDTARSVAADLLSQGAREIIEAARIRRR